MLRRILDLFGGTASATPGIRFDGLKRDLTSPLARRISALSVFVLANLISAPTSATIVLPSNLYSCVHRAGVIFAGTVSAMSTEKLKTAIVTHVEFTDVRYVKGVSLGGKTRLTLEGGTAGNRRVFSIGQPEFALGQRYIVLAYEDFGSPQNSYLPIVGLYQGFFHVVHDTATGLISVHDWAGRQLVRIDQHRLVVAGSMGSAENRDSDVEIIQQSSAGGTRLSESDFLTELLKLASEK